MKAVVMVNGTRIEISGKTQEIETLFAENPLYESIMKRELENPPLIALYAPRPNTALAFYSILEEWERETSRKIEIVEWEGIDKIPYEEGVVY